MRLPMSESSERDCKDLTIPVAAASGIQLYRTSVSIAGAPTDSQSPCRERDFPRKLLLQPPKRAVPKSEDRPVPAPRLAQYHRLSGRVLLTQRTAMPTPWHPWAGDRAISRVRPRHCRAASVSPCDCAAFLRCRPTTLARRQSYLSAPSTFGLRPLICEPVRGSCFPGRSDGRQDFRCPRRKYISARVGANRECRTNC